MSDDLRRIADAVRFWQQITDDARRTVYCEPHRVQEIRDALEREGAGHLYEVVGNSAVPAGQLLIVDPPALEAAHRQALQRSLKAWRYPG